MALDLSADYLLIDDPITVNWLRKQEEGQPPVQLATVEHVQKNGVTKEDLAANTSWLLKETSVFHLWKANCPANLTPRIGDRITHDGVNWVVESVGYLDRDADGVQRYRLVCVRSKA